MAERPHIRYSPLSTHQPRRPPPPPHDDPDDRRYSYDPFRRIPWKSIALALFLLSFGSLCLILAYLIFSGHMGGDRGQVYGFLTIGLLLFIPGFYETRIAYYSMRGAKGYSFTQIPEY